jgi:hypothetical protein
MGNIAVTTIATITVAGNKRFHNGVLTLSNNYAAGGDAFTPAQFGLFAVDVLGLSEPDGGLLFAVDYVNSKIKAYTALGVEVVGGQNLSAININYDARGN